MGGLKLLLFYLDRHGNSIEAGLGIKGVAHLVEGFPTEWVLSLIPGSHKSTGVVHTY